MVTLHHITAYKELVLDQDSWNHTHTNTHTHIYIYIYIYIYIEREMKFSIHFYSEVISKSFL